MANDFIIATASTCDLTKEYLAEHNVPFVGYNYILEENNVTDDCDEEKRQKIYESMRQGSLLSTAAINQYAYHEFFESLLKTGKDVIYMDMSKELSSSFNSARLTAQEMEEEYPNQKFVCIDTCCVSGGLGLLVEGAVARKEEGKNFDEVVDWIEENKLKIIHRFTVDDFKWLRMGGRVSNAAALVGTLLSIKPVMYVPDDGTLTVSGKVRGRKNALNSILESMKSDLVNPDGQIIKILHADCREDAEYMKEQILAMFPSVAGVSISNLGVVIGAHCGPGLFTIFYMGEKRVPK